MEKEDRLQEIKKQLTFDLLSAGLDVIQYGFAIDLTVTALYERERAYEAYKKAEREGLRLSPYLSRLQAWTTQARTCLSMLKLTPTRKQRPTADDDAGDTDVYITL